MFPRFFKLSLNGGHLFAMRWRKFGYDVLLSKSGLKLVHWCKGETVKFACIIPRRAESTPIFLLSTSYRCDIRTRLFACGTTSKRLLPLKG